MTLPADKFRTALAGKGSAKDFHNVLVDWWDAAAEVWRPSVVDGRAEGFETSFRTHADILFPETAYWPNRKNDCETRSVRIADLRPSRLVDDGLARFFTTRYALEVLDDLQPCILSGCDSDRSQLDTVARDLRRVYDETYSAWRTAFETGTPNHSGVGTVCHVDDDLDVMRALGRADFGAGRALEMFRKELVNGELSCSPVGWWDEQARAWRPTILVGATGLQTQFMPRSRVRIIIPDLPIAVREVCGADLKPLDIATAGFSLCALPVLIRDLLQMHRGLLACGAGDVDVQFDPMLSAIGEMLTGAAREWGAQFALGLPGAQPQPRVAPLAPEFWGLTTSEATDDVHAWWQQSPSRE